MKTLKGMVKADFEENTDINREKAAKAFFSFLKRSALFKELKLDASKLKHSGNASSYKEDASDSHSLRYSFELTMTPMKGESNAWMFDGQIAVSVKGLRLEPAVDKTQYLAKIRAPFTPKQIDDLKDFELREGKWIIGHTRAIANNFKRAAHAYTLLTQKFTDWK